MCIFKVRQSIKKNKLQPNNKRRGKFTPTSSTWILAIQEKTGCTRPWISYSTYWRGYYSFAKNFLCQISSINSYINWWSSKTSIQAKWFTLTSAHKINQVMEVPIIGFYSKTQTPRKMVFLHKYKIIID